MGGGKEGIGFPKDPRFFQKKMVNLTILRKTCHSLTYLLMVPDFLMIAKFHYIIFEKKDTSPFWLRYCRLLTRVLSESIVTQDRVLIPFLASSFFLGLIFSFSFFFSWGRGAKMCPIILTTRAFGLRCPRNCSHNAECSNSRIFLPCIKPSLLLSSESKHAV